jgi:hypothetical protein
MHESFVFETFFSFFIPQIYIQLQVYVRSPTEATRLRFDQEK